MTKEQYKSKVEELNNRIYTIRKEIIKVTEQYLATCPYQVGDKVKVKHGVNISTVYVLKIEAPVLESEEYRYTFAAPKMDGTMSNKKCRYQRNDNRKTITHDGNSIAGTITGRRGVL